MKIKVTAIDDEQAIEALQATLEDSCAKKSRRESVKRLRRANGKLKTHYVGKLATDVKKFSEFRHNRKKNDCETRSHIKRKESRCAATFRDAMIPHEGCFKSRSRGNEIKLPLGEN